MTKVDAAKIAGIWLVVTILAVQFISHDVLPIISLYIYRGSYVQVSHGCNEALSYKMQAIALTNEQNDQTAIQLLRSVEVAMIDCQFRDAFRHELLAKGVSEHFLQSLEADALMLSAPSIADNAPVTDR